MSTPVNLDLQETKTAKLVYGDKEIDLPLIEGTEGERAIDIGALRARRD